VSTTRLFIGQIGYLNSQPFYPLLEEHRLVSMPPRKLGELAERGEIDAGIMATGDYLRLTHLYEPIADLGVANREEVRSILLFSRRPLASLEGARVGLTEESSTSVRLLRLILEVREGLRPASYTRGLRREADAYLVIGNEALAARRSPPEGFPHRYDLATEWWTWKRLPFVFALWVIKKSIPDQVKNDFAALLRRSFAKGMAELPDICRRFAGELGSAAELVSYLKNFHYHLGPEERKGLEEFRKLSVEHGLLEPI
jgi:chorismate dehydratase